jgi:ATP-dependent RNA helicase DeaD
VTAPTTFAEFGLSRPILTALAELGHEAPTSIQGRTIPALLAGRDLVGQAQTGTGKTAAFALPILERLDVSRAQLQALVLAPTRELAIQVAEATHAYGKHQPGLRVLPVYGGSADAPAAQAPGTASGAPRAWAAPASPCSSSRRARRA